jgi:uncharacterized RDD family membrane protein YckC
MDETPRGELLGTLYERLFTFVLDEAIMVAGAALIGLVLSGLGTPTVLAYIFGALLATLYAPALMTRGGERNGQTFARQMVGLRVVRDDRKPMDFRTALLRDGVFRYLVGTLTAGLFLVASAIPALRSPHRLTLHDTAAGTFVARSASRWISAPAEVVPAPAAPEEPTEFQVRA